MTEQHSRAIVALVVWNREELCLLRRSAAVSWDAGRWHCVTGYLDDKLTPLEQGLTELDEELGLEPHQVAVTSMARFTLDGWLVHAYSVDVSDRAVTLNWENDAHRWVTPEGLEGHDIVWWLPEVLRALATSSEPVPSTPVPARSS